MMEKKKKTEEKLVFLIICPFSGRVGLMHNYELVHASLLLDAQLSWLFPHIVCIYITNHVIWLRDSTRPEIPKKLVAQLVVGCGIKTFSVHLFSNDLTFCMVWFGLTWYGMGAWKHCTQAYYYSLSTQKCHIIITRKFSKYPWNHVIFVLNV